MAAAQPTDSTGDSPVPRAELSPEWALLGRLWSYHAFILLCILGAGGFLLPRFLGMGARHSFDTSPKALTAERE